MDTHPLTRQQQLAMIKKGLRNARVDVSCSKGKASGLIRVMRDGRVLREHNWKDLNTEREVLMFINSAAVSVHLTKDEVRIRAFAASPEGQEFTL